MQLYKETRFRCITGKEKIHMCLFLRLQAADDLWWSKTDYTVSGFRRVLHFYIVQIGRYFIIR